MTTKIGGITWERTLHNTEGGADKLYRVQVVCDNQTYGVRCDSCRRGNAWVDQGWKHQGLATLEEAVKKAEAVMKGKVKGGYKITGSFENTEALGTAEGPQAPVGISQEAKARTGFRPQLLNSIEEAEAEQLILDDRWVMEEKKDGRRRSIQEDQNGLTGINKLGEAVPVEHEMAEAARTMFGTSGFLVDGEIIGDTLHAFDLLQVGEGKGGDLREMGYMARKERLGLFAKFHPAVAGSISVVQTHVGREAKRKAFDALKTANAEGVVFKLKDAPFKEGRPNSNGDQRKYKFTATATFICCGTKPGKRSIRLGILDKDGNVQDMGFCTIPANHEIPADQTLVEVRYLYAFPNGGKLHQPCYLGERDDIRYEEAVIEQLKFKPTGETDGDDE